MLKTTEIEKSLAEIDLRELAKTMTYTPSPTAWEDKVFYFVMLDRFSDGQENEYIDNHGNNVITGETSPYRDKDNADAITSEADSQNWRDHGLKWTGGNLKGLTSKMGYLKRMGVTALWVTPVFRQVNFQETYHGYGIQNFIDIDPHFGTREDLKTMVATAHDNGINVILDVVLNHAGNVFGYSHNDNYYYFNGEKFPVEGFKDKEGYPTIPFEKVDLSKNPEVWPSGAVWPSEFQYPEAYTQEGQIRNWGAESEYLNGDFCDFKDINLGYGNNPDTFAPSSALDALCKAYKFWIAYADIDGFRMDAVKHMLPGAVRYFTLSIQEFAKSIGKENFYIIGEITGGRQAAYDTLDITGLSAALGIDDVEDKLEYMVKGWRNPFDYFDLFRNSILVRQNSHVWFRDKIITMINDHDGGTKGAIKSRFCADINGDKLVFNSLALNLMTLGIPCIYYGTEQKFDGRGDGDRYIREAMFGGEFGAFRSKHKHFFNEDCDVYQKLAEISEIRKKNMILRRGRQYLRQISGNGYDFDYPHMLGNGIQMRSIVPWSRVFNDQEVLLAINTDSENDLQAWITIDNSLNQEGSEFTCFYSTNKDEIGNKTKVEQKNGKSIYVKVPKAGFVIYAQDSVLK